MFVEQPLEEALAPLYALLLRTGVLVITGLGLSVLASLVLARRMVRRIQALQAGAARIGAGALEQRIEARTGDELEDLAESFNRMSGRLRESYATLERKVEERTRDLADALRQLRALGEVSQVVNSSFDLQHMLTTIVTHAVQLLGTDGGAIYEFDEAAQEFQLRATHGMSDELIAAIRSAPTPSTPPSMRTERSSCELSSTGARGPSTSRPVCGRWTWRPRSASSKG